ncbi:hypothetical protein [Aeromicrobium sp. Leaf350]|uniref:hypothetical protein n=1 Tax=Aeromicrobium sp. Leaf350 TaxID=2876565 RepID=UPI001E40B688|nr:hypothetical protein [Aeromicrobium sp. Leaf350]
MRSVAVKVLVGVVSLIAFVAVSIGLVTPGGTERPDSAPDPSPSPSSSVPSAEPTAEPPPADPAALAPASVAGVWPGRPASTTETAGVVDWCPAVQADVSAAAAREVGDEAARAAACSAVAFTFDVRYSRLSLPRQTYAREDFAPAEARLTDASRAETYPGRIDAVVAAPRSSAAREATGLVLLDGPGPGAGRQFFGEPWTETGYTDRAVWVDPAWSTVRVDLERGGSRPRLRVSLEASAGVPVWNPGKGVAEKLTIATTSTYVLDGPDWRVNGWTLTQDRAGFAPLP